MTNLFKLCLTVIWGILLPSLTIAQDQPRFALVIGNEQYEIGALRNPVNDARSMTASLMQSGFTTKLLENVTAEEFQTGITKFLDSLPEGAIGLFYYAGHAIQRDGRNYLLPVDVKAESADAIISKSIDAAQVVERFHKSGVDFSIVILDACRNNPFLADDSEHGRGLASMESDAGETLIGFATQAGEVAYDGTGPNSPYTGALINEINKPGKDILDVFRSVRRSVRVWTNGQQRPFISASIERKFAFKKPTTTAAPNVDIGDLTLQSVRPVVERIWWNVIQESPVPGDFRNFVNHFPESVNVVKARNLVLQLEQSDQSVRGIVFANFSVPEERRSVHGLSAVVTACDIDAGDPDDPRRITDGVPWGLVNVRQGLQECSAALAMDPTNPRLLHLMGRLLDIQSRYDEAEQFYRLASSLNYNASLVNLGFMYVSAKGRDRDYEQALKLYRQAADLGNLRARTNIGEMFERGWFVERNLDEAILWYHLAAQNGWPNALDTLGNMYRRGTDKNGNGPAQDLDEAARLYTIAAELGSTNAMNNLGRLYLSDALVEENKDLGLDWLARASERGNRFAPFHLGRIYRNGKLVERDHTRAIELFERSADLGFAPARIAIGRMHVDGNGVPKSKENAAFYFTLAALTADGKRPRQKEEAEERLGALGLDDEALSRARALALEWLRLNG